MVIKLATLQFAHRKRYDFFFKKEVKWQMSIQFHVESNKILSVQIRLACLRKIVRI